jgi:hypothetical protein
VEALKRPQRSEDLDWRAELGRTAHSGGGQRLLCRACGQPITDDASRTSVAGSHLHRRTNPVGITFDFWCFEQAPGAIQVGQPTHEHSWFSGHAWAFALCRACGEQLGWAFEGEQPPRFFALICDRLEPEEESPPPS